MLRIVAAVAALAVGGTFAFAQNAAVIKERREAMRAVGKAGAANFKMMKGDAPFELAAVQAGLATFQTTAAKLKTLFPEDSKTGGPGTDAKPAIWTARAEFDAAVDGWGNTVKAAAAAIKDEASFKTEYPKVAATCGGCHKADGGYTINLGESFKKMGQPLQ